ncbi:MAG TPA: putative inorganic carbon transporter subunit DabA, partial [Gemmataceae bacterium]|nr:putative inorganic carbon transporter subunit DabA [Gemmataceae bacterium]
MGDQPAHDRDHLQHLIDHAAHLLPAQGPITVFIHHNTLHAFEDRRFTAAVEHGARVFGCQPYLPKERYRAELARGRIRFDDLEAVLREDLRDRADERVVLDCTRLRLHLAMLEHPLRSGTTEELLWFVGETDALRRVRPEVSPSDRARLVAETRRWALRDLRPGAATLWADLFDRCGSGPVEDWGPESWEALALHALWRICRAGAGAVPAPAPAGPRPVRLRDLLVAVTGADPDLLVHDLLIRFCAAFLDQGLAAWALPRRDEGFLKSFCALYVRQGGPPERWRRGLAAELSRYAATHAHALDWVRGALDELGVPEPEWEAYLSATLLALRGWAGMIRFLEERGDRAIQPAPDGSLVEFLAVRLVLDGLAAAYVAHKTIGFGGSLGALRDELVTRYTPAPPPSAEQRAFQVFQIAQILGWTPEEMAGLAPTDWDTLLAEVEAFSTAERRRLFHLAYERRFYVRCLDAIHSHAAEPTPTPARPRLQAVFCIDEREESIRRHLEEVAPDVETLGTAGFFSLPMYFKGAA